MVGVREGERLGRKGSVWYCQHSREKRLSEAVRGALIRARGGGSPRLYGESKGLGKVGKRTIPHKVT